MNFAINKTAAFLIAILMTIAISSSIMMLPTASAHDPPAEVPTDAYINVAREPGRVSVNRCSLSCGEPTCFLLLQV